MAVATPSTKIQPFRVDVPQADLDDLYERLARARLPQPPPLDDWDYGVPNSYLTETIDYWRNFDWRGAGGANQRLPPVPHRDRRPGRPLHPRAVEGGRRDAGAPPAHLPRLVRRLPRHDRPTDRPGRVWRRRR